MIKGRMIRKRETPAAFIAVSSKFSPKFPKVISEANKMAKGKAIGIKEKVAYTKNSARTDIPMPFPTSSAMCFHKNCSNKMRIQIRKVIKNSVKKRLNMYMSNFLNMSAFLEQQIYRKSSKLKLVDISTEVNT